MTRFESEGVRRQQESLSVAEAKARFKKTCDYCASHGFGGNCAQCPVNAAHSFVTETFSILKRVEADMRLRKAFVR